MSENNPDENQNTPNEQPEHPNEEKSKHEKDREKREQRGAEREKISSQTKFKSTSKRIATYAIAALLVIGAGYGIFSFLGDSGSPTGNVAADGIPNYPIHWHPHLRIIVDGEQQVIPANVGISPGYHAPIHTHDTDGILHAETAHPTEKTLKLGYFFEVWGKRLIWNDETKNYCIFENCNEGDNVVRVFVDGKQISDPLNLILRDKMSILVLYGPVSDDAAKYFEDYVAPTPGDIRM